MSQEHNRFAGPPVVAVAGATGAVGAELLNCLERRGFPIADLRLLASERSAGRTLSFAGRDYQVQPLTAESFEGVDLALLATDSGISRQFAPAARAAGTVVIDASSAFRMDADVPLVVPEANGEELASHTGLIANPNCVAAIATVALAPLNRSHSIRRLNLATYQAASGAGQAGMDELEQATRAHLQGETYQPQEFPHPYAFNFFSHNSDMDPESGHNGEELKVVAETRRILGRAQLPVGVTCIRVPILRAHGMAVSVEFDNVVAADDVRALLSDAPGVRVVDDVARNYFPMPSDVNGGDDVLVGRIRQDLGDPSGRTIALFIVGDQLLKGAALNAVQIAEHLLAG